MVLVGGIGGGIGGGLGALFFRYFGFLGLGLLIVILAILLTFSMMLFCHFRPRIENLKPTA
jgi:hypothetical protein